MALDRKFFFGFQTGGEEEFAGGVASGLVVTSPATWSDKEANYCYRLTWKQQLHAPKTYDSTGVWNTFSFNIRFENSDQGQTSNWYESRDETGITHLKLRTLANFPGSVEIVDANGTVLGTVLGHYTDDKWYRVTIKYGRANGTPLRVWMVPSEQITNGTPLFTFSNIDSFVAGGTFVMNHMLHNSGWTSGIPAAIFIGSAYCFTDTEGSIDTERILGAFVTLGPYNDVFQSSTSRFGNNLTSGRWDDIADVPTVDADVAEYQMSFSVSLKEGGVTADDISGHIGPLGDSRVDGSLLQMMGVFRAKKSGTGMAITFYGKYGTATPADVAVDRTQTINFGALTTSFQDFVHFSTVVPSTTAARYAQIGMKAQKTSGISNTKAQMSMGAVYFLHEEPRLLIVDGKSQLIGA